jgi:hypothetical protein
MAPASRGFLIFVSSTFRPRTVNRSRTRLFREMLQLAKRKRRILGRGVLRIARDRAFASALAMAPYQA